MKHIAAVLLLIAAGIAQADITSPTNGSSLTGSSVNVTWTDDANKYWIWLYKGSDKIHDSGAISSTSYNLPLPADGSSLKMRFWKFTTRWEYQDMNYTSDQTQASTNSSGGYQIVERRCVFGNGEMPVAGNHEYTELQCDVRCPSGMAISGEAVGIGEAIGGGASNDPVADHRFSTEGLGTGLLSLFMDNPPNRDYFDNFKYTVDATAVCVN